MTEVVEPAGFCTKQSAVSRDQIQDRVAGVGGSQYAVSQFESAPSRARLPSCARLIVEKHKVTAGGEQHQIVSLSGNEFSTILADP